MRAPPIAAAAEEVADAVLDHLDDVQAAVRPEVEAGDGQPSAKTVQGPLLALASQTTFRALGETRQTRDAPGVNGKPLSSPTYHQPSGPTATVVGTASAGNSRHERRDHAGWQVRRGDDRVRELRDGLDAAAGSDQVQLVAAASARASAPRRDVIP